MGKYNVYMADLSNNSSFIPKRGPSKRKRGAHTRQVYVFTLASYIFLFATLLGAGGLYLYDDHTKKQLNNEITLLDSAIRDFNEPDVLRVQEFDSRLSQAADRVNKGVSIVSVFEALEESTIDTVVLESLSLTREMDSQFVLTASIETDSFDSTIFQRDVYGDYQKVDSIIIENFSSDFTLNEESSSGDNEDSEPAVKFTAKITLPLSAVPYEPNQEEDLEEALSEASESEAASVDPEAVLEEDANNETDI